LNGIVDIESMGSVALPCFKIGDSDHAEIDHTCKSITTRSIEKTGKTFH
jgi:hypothetical protein